MDIDNLINAAISGDKEAAVSAFNAAIAAKMTDALDVKKVEIASNLLGTNEVETNEPEATQVEVDGTDASNGEAAEAGVADATV